MEKFLYIVKPRIPIRNLVKGKLIFREATLMLSLDEVKMCLKHGPVYRKFANDPKTAIQVTLNNCERLHQRDYVTELNVASTFIPKEDPEEVKPVAEEPVDDVVVETTEAAVEEAVDEAVVETTEAAEVTEEAAEVAEEAVDEVVAEESSVDNTQKQQNNHSKNKKRK